jgi:hypothetical protein
LRAENRTAPSIACALTQRRRHIDSFGIEAATYGGVDVIRQAADVDSNSTHLQAAASNCHIAGHRMGTNLKVTCDDPALWLDHNSDT